MAYQYPDTVIQVFCKAPIAGQVKTRLTPDLTFEQAAQIHKQLTKRILKLVHSSHLCPLQLWCSPSVSHSFFIEMADTFSLSLQLQSTGNLGHRMFNALLSGKEQFKHVILIGCDCVSLTIADFNQAISALSTKYDCVLAPAEDGGYCLIACNQAIPELFNGINWGSDTVLHNTRKKTESLSLNCLELAMQWDVDNYNDYLRYLHLEKN
ncbi:MAG: glycosyltransferase [Methylococcales symbiont of Hymedesmia sp. n. MRB-2018]|nr:MAG: glycosyltransferase [Methylococcales symbiont of Hymedesmia sp. n. MRB-2018]KAF3983757.1 MAG: glycosyltransferase [Methylococcales symbiont of Hymedesmia sp. n. MRB-2018]